MVSNNLSWTLFVHLKKMLNIHFAIGFQSLRNSHPFMCFNIISPSISTDFCLFVLVFSFSILFIFLSFDICFSLGSYLKYLLLLCQTLAILYQCRGRMHLCYINIVVYSCYYVIGFIMLLCCWCAFCFVFTKYVVVSCIIILLLTGRNFVTILRKLIH